MTGVGNAGSGQVTALLRAWQAGDDEAYRKVSEILYVDLRRQAARCLRRAYARDTLQTTALLHDAFIRLAGAHDVSWQDRNHFLAVAGQTMRRVVVDLARERAAAKRGSRAVTVPLDSGVAVGGPPLMDLLALERALEKLATIDPRKVQVVELKFFAGLTVGEIADVLRVSADTVARDWRMARTWLLRELDTPPA
jgi:RNA polymerase sigma factor (TIGR02999 family)